MARSCRGRRGHELIFDQSLKFKEEPLRKLAEPRGWSITRVYCDRISGTADVRSGLTELLADARRGCIDEVRLSGALNDWTEPERTAVPEHGRPATAVPVELAHEQSFDTRAAMGKLRQRCSQLWPHSDVK
ncbi:MAG TPA: recombinase family protein [Bryobacteraceae bacterium]|nr:recombinase family protein [Bryobacteraceae bacterium]